MTSDSNQRVVDHFGALAAHYGVGFDDSTVQRLKALLVAREAEPGGLVVDVGCGNGLHFAAATMRGARVVGVDRSEAMLTAAGGMGRVRDGTFVARADAAAIPIADAAADLAYCYSTLVVVADPHQVIREMARVLKPGGVAIIDLAGRLSPSFLGWGLWYRARGLGRLQGFTRRRALQAMADSGLDPIEVHAAGTTDFLKLIPILRRIRSVERFFHGGELPDRDYRLSNQVALRPFAARWYVVARRR